MPPKRKRNERPSEAGGSRPAPHRPSDTALAQHDRTGPARNTRRNADRRDSSGTGASSQRGPTSPSMTRPSSSSSQTATIANPPTASGPHTHQSPSAIAATYNYLILTEARLSSWQQNGRQDVVEHGVESRNDEDVEEITTISQEFIHAVLEHRLNPTDAGDCMKQILGPEVARDDDTTFLFDAQSLFLDTISVFIDSEDVSTTTQLRDFISATGIAPKLLREVLDAPALQHLGLIRETFIKLGIRYATNQLYRQANYNLLREESEGYSKLAAELYRTPFSSQGHHDFALVQACWERVKALIGTFDLDVGRVLDVVIDVFSATMLRNIVFFSRFLRISSWWPRNQVEHAANIFAGGLPRWALPENEDANPDALKGVQEEQIRQRDLEFWNRARDIHLDAFFELGGRKVDIDLEGLSDVPSNGSIEPQTRLAWIKSTKTLPPCGNRVAAQLLGFKFRFYTSAARDKGETLPANLYYLAAFLIKIGFVSLADLYPHLWPADADMDSLKRRREDELNEKERNARQGNEPNALLMAGALSDDTAMMTTRPRDGAVTKSDTKDQETSTKSQDDDASLPEPKEAQKADIVSHLLVVGAIPEALFIIGRFPWLPDAYPDDIYPAINRILLHSISKVFQDIRPVELRPVATSCIKPDVAQDQSGMPKGNLKLQDGAPAKILKWPHADGISKGTLYRFYLDEWSDNVPICQTIEDVFTLCNTFLNISGVNIGRDPTLVKKIAMIGARSFHQDQSPENVGRWQDLLRRILVPSLCLTGANVDTVATVWDLLKHYPTKIRYSIYADCYEGAISRLPAMKQAFKTARLDTLAILKRLALQNIPMTAKKLAKIALSSPGVVCKVALDQIESYTNLIEAFVECTKYFTEMGHDVLVWSLLTSLGGKQRSRTQESSVLLTSRWLQALSRFSGKVFRRFEIDPTPVLQYVNDQVAHGNSTDLVILRELINSMAGIVPDTDFTDAQLSALSGDEVLRRQTLVQLGDKRFESDRSASRFMKALLQTNIASQLLTNMAQYRQSAIYQFSEDESHIKFLATVIDESQQALVQYVELLRSNLAPRDFDAQVPSIPILMTDYGLDANLAFMIGRASLRYYMTGPGSNAPAKLAVDGEGDAVMELNGTTDPAAKTPVPEETEDPMPVEATDGQEGSPENAASSALNTPKSDRFLEVLRPIIDAIRPLLPPNTWNKMSPEFFVLFWSLQSGDLVAPTASYIAEHKKLEKERNDLKKDVEHFSSKNSDPRKSAKVAEFAELIKAVYNEVGTCKERVSKTKLLLMKQSPIWFDTAASIDSVTDTFIEECLLPRMLLSPGDADFCHRLVKFLHLARVRHFKLSTLYDRFFNVNRLRTMIFGCTVREAEFLGRFIKLTLADLAVWHKEKGSYERDATGQGRYGFATAFDASGKPESFMEHDKFRDLLWTWHRNLSAALRACLMGTEWMHIRNAITILKAGLENFPAVDFMGRQFMQLLAKIAEREAATKTQGEDGQSHRVDLSVTANTAISALKKRTPSWVMVQAFRSNTSGESAEERKAAESSKPSLGLRPSAPEFKPQPASTSAPSKGNGEEEDGEVEDVKASSTDAHNTALTSKDPNAGKPLPFQRDIHARSSSTPQRAEPRSGPNRSSTPKATIATSTPPAGARHESSRASTLAPAPGLPRAPGLPKAPGLPSRPEVPFPSYFTQDPNGAIRTLERNQRDSRDPRELRDTKDQRDSREPRDSRDPSSRESRDSRDPREPRDSRPLRAGEEPRVSRAREQQPTERRGGDSLPRESYRAESRPSHRPDTSRRAEPSQADNDTRLTREPLPPASAPANRGSDTGRPPRDSPAVPKAMPPPQQADPPGPPGPPLNPERARLIQSDRPDERPSPANPPKTGLMNDTRAPSRTMREDGRDRNSPRPLSPRRGDRSDYRMAETTRDERPGRSHRSEHLTSSTRDHRDEFQQSGVSRNGRLVDHDGDRLMMDRPRDSAGFQGPHTTSRGESDRNRHMTQDPEYGRLSSIPATADMSNAPEGPRGRGRNAMRPPTNAPLARSEARYQSNESQHPPSPDVHLPPTGPASSRPRRSQPGAQHGPNSASSPAATGTPSAGIHPERMRQFNVEGVPSVSSSQSQSPYPASLPAPAPVHPSRMPHIPQQPHHQNSRPPPSFQTPDRPAMGAPGHRYPSGNHTMTPGSDNSPMAMSAPTGPSAANDRARGGGRRQLTGINTILQGGPNVRGKGSRSNLIGGDVQVLTGSSPVSTPVNERPEMQFPSDRPMAGERSGRHDYERGRREHEHAERPTRGSRRSSRERSSERSQRPKEHREYRERKSDVGASGYGREGEREPMRSRSVREHGSTSRGHLPTTGRGHGDLISNGREPRHRGDGTTGGRHEDYARGGGGGGGGSGMGGSMRGTGPPREDRRELLRVEGEDQGGGGGSSSGGSRKRHSEEFGGRPNDKRLRR